MVYFTINLAEKPSISILNIKKQKYAKLPSKMKTRRYRTIFFKLKRNLKVNNEAAKRI